MANWYHTMKKRIEREEKKGANVTRRGAKRSMSINKLITLI